MAVLFYVALGLLLKFLWDITRLFFSDNFEADFHHSTRIVTARRHEEIQFQYRLTSRRIEHPQRIPEH